MAGRRVRTPRGLSAFAVAGAAVLAVVLTMAYGPIGATAAPGDTPDLASMVRAVSDPRSPLYRHFETPAQVAQYMPTGLWGSARSAPGAGAHLMHPQRIATTATGDAKAKAKTCSDYFGQLTSNAYPVLPGGTTAKATGQGWPPVATPLAICGYTPDQLRSAYDTDGDSGRGVTVAILGAYNSPTMPADADRYATDHGDEGFASGQYTQYLMPGTWTLQDQCGVDSWAAEQTLDVEAVHALAPRASILYVGADSCQDPDMLAALARVVGNRMADVVTASWGSPLHTVDGDEPAGVIATYERLFQIAALEGITIDFAAGDCGANLPGSGCGRAVGSVRAQTTFPASDLWVTAVGGTSLAIGADGDPLWHAAWGTRAWELNGTTWKPLGWVFGGGGGASEDFAQPWYQVDQVPQSLAQTLLDGQPAPSARRVVPDISLDGDPFTGMLIGQTRSDNGGPVQYGESEVGGTSLAAPLLAGLEADMAARAYVWGPVRAGLGFLNPALYMLAGSSHLTDVTGVVDAAGQLFPAISGVSVVFAAFGDDGSLAATAGYDAATGLGTPGEDFTRALDQYTER